MATQLAPAAADGLCAMCGVPVDARYFDSSNVAAPPRPGREVLLASFDLPPEYCGVLMYFAQFTDRQARDRAAIDTPELEWTLRLNGRPLDPYLGLRWIVNPWGYGSFPLGIRLDENARLEFVARGTTDAIADPTDPINLIAGRLVGRYWYNPVYGHPHGRRS
jgi:hypothetical protein